MMDFRQYTKSIILKGIWNTTSTINNRVVFSSFSGRSYSDNTKAISEKLYELAPDTDIVWMGGKERLEGLPHYVKQIDVSNSYLHYKTLASARVVVENNGFNNIPKKNNQLYIQTSLPWD